MFIRFDRIHERDTRTDGQANTARRQRLRLRIASRGKKMALASNISSEPIWYKNAKIKITKIIVGAKSLKFKTIK